MIPETKIKAGNLGLTTDFLPSHGASCCASFVRMFKPQFAPLVEAGIKLQTVRPTPKRMPRPGDRISLRCWLGKPYRSKQRTLRVAEVSKVESIRIADSGISIYDGKGIGYVADPESFAKLDGFGSWPEMKEWFAKEHSMPFVGVVIHWHNVHVVAPGSAVQKPEIKNELDR